MEREQKEPNPTGLVPSVQLLCFWLSRKRVKLERVWEFSWLFRLAFAFLEVNQQA
jgi:hypothetical protein